MTEPDTTIERRREPRLRTLLTGIIALDHNSTFDCVIRSLSAHGARIAIADAHRLPETFDLVIPHHRQTHRAALLWRHGEQAGLVLSDSDRPPSKPKLTKRQQQRLRERELARGLM
jgi:hypothetical protein